ncbi:MAG: 2,3-bisphosphoglycerate-dependent phosphoglycerate mutase [Pseudomonadota bacterium]
MNAPQRLAVFIRHGHSEWNLGNRFTGWTDIPLTESGLAEAAAAGRLLAAAGHAFDEAHASVLRRTRQTIEALLAGAGHAAIPIHETWRLNERHYGALQGLDKGEIFAAWGEAQARRWWRGYFEPPPALAPDDPRHPRFSPLYRDLDPALLPAAESLCDCQLRVLPYWEEVLRPRIAAGRRLLIASHGNTLRALIMHLDGIDAEAMEHVEVPSGVPLVYRFAADMTVLGREWLT